MRKFVLMCLGFFSVSIANEIDGYKVYQKHCSACHLEKISMKQMKKFESIVKAGGKLPIKAPPFPEVSARVKYFYPKKENFINFVVDYITNPSREKAKCLPMAIERLGLMPPIGKGMAPEEKRAVASWLYENYNTKWEDMPMGKMRKHNMERKCLQKE